MKGGGSGASEVEEQPGLQEVGPILRQVWATLPLLDSSTELVLPGPKCCPMSRIQESESDWSNLGQAPVPGSISSEMGHSYRSKPCAWRCVLDWTVPKFLLQIPKPGLTTSWGETLCLLEPQSMIHCPVAVPASWVLGAAVGAGKAVGHGDPGGVVPGTVHLLLMVSILPHGHVGDLGLCALC